MLSTADALTEYHLHVAPVPADGNCTATLAHLDPVGFSGKLH